MELTLPNLRHLRAFFEVAERQSISRAAPRVFLSQPAITQAIGKLEESLQTRLFERRNDGMLPTEGGTLFAIRVGRALTLVRCGAQDALRAVPERTTRPAAPPEQLFTTTQLRALVAVANAGNFSLAARAIGTSQPALHRAARELEGLLATKLFERTHEGIELTRPGQILAQQCKLAFAELAQGFAEIHALGGRDTGKIVVGAMPLSRHLILPKAINALAGELPEVEVHEVDGPYEELLHGLRHGEIDFLVGALRNPLPVDDIVQERLFDDPLAIVARAGHPLKGRRNLTIRDLAAYSWVVPRSGTPTRDQFDAMFRSQRIAPPPGLVESSSPILIRGLLLESDRLTMISPHQVGFEQDQGLLATLPFDLKRSRRPIGITTRRDWHPTATQARFLDLVRTASKGYSEIE